MLPSFLNQDDTAAVNRRTGRPSADDQEGGGGWQLARARSGYCPAQPWDGTANWRIESHGRYGLPGSWRQGLSDKGRRGENIQCYRPLDATVIRASRPSDSQIG